MYSYEIKEKKYTQRPLVLGQMVMLIALLEGVGIKSMTGMGMIMALGDLLPRALAILLIPEGCTSLKARDIDSMAAALDEIPIDRAIEIVADFLECSQISSLLASLDGLAIKMMAARQPATGLTSLSANSPTET